MDDEEDEQQAHQHWMSYYLLPQAPLLAMVFGWRCTLAFQHYNCVSFDISRRIIGKAAIKGYRKNLDPYQKSRQVKKSMKKEQKPLKIKIPYVYQALPSHQHIRLAHLKSGTNEAPLSISFTEHLLSEAPAYEALSYVWGRKSYGLISCGPCLVTARKNLLDALTAIRQPDIDRILWIDALCINQEDKEEKAQQVQMMRAIYAASQRTIVWLGIEGKHSAKAVDFLRYLAELWELEVTSGGLQSVSEFKPPESGTWNDVADIFSNEWFHRIWIVQEVVVAREVVIQYGSQSFPWNVLADAAKISMVRLQGFHSLFNPADALKLGNLREFYHKHGPFSTIQQMFPITKQSLSTLDVDKVYALIGLTKDDFVVTYNESVRDTFIRLATKCIRSETRLDFLNIVDDHTYRLNTNLLSWVPDFEVRHGPQLFVNFSGYQHWFASKKERSTASLSADDQVLMVRGYVIDRIHRLGQFFGESVPSIGGANPWLLADTKLPVVGMSGRMIWATARMHQWHHLATTHATMFAEGRDRHDAYIATLIADAASNQFLSSFEGLERLAKLRKAYIAFCKMWEPAMYGADEAVAAWGKLSPEEFTLAAPFVRAHIDAAWGRTIFMTKPKGAIGLCPRSTRQKDLLVVLEGARTPFVLRPLRNGKYKFVGECYAHGFMHGEGEELNTANSMQFALV